ncbi:MAG: cyclic nucleotide-binding domain-containing protein [Alphaproteobacteria bacterium]|nr:cyclic nucleotide-binding domain-containing protein [Alphaproteobacteria bacterium]
MMVLQVALVGLIATSSVMIGAALGLYFPTPRKVLAGILAFAAGSLIASLAIELAFGAAHELTQSGTNVHVAWAAIAGGFGAGAAIYYAAALFLEQKGAAVRYPSRFLEHALRRKRREAGDRLAPLSKCQLLRHLPPEHLLPLLDRIRERPVKTGEVVFHRDDVGDALYIVAAGRVAVLDEHGRVMATLSEGEAFGEMALLTGAPRTATVRAEIDSRLLLVTKQDFDELCASDPFLDAEVRQLSHDRALANLGRADVDPAMWARTARHSINSLSRSEEHRPCHRVRQHPRHHSGLLGDRCEILGLRKPVHDLDHRHVSGRHPRSGGERDHATAGRLQRPHHLLAVEHGAAGGRRGGNRRQARDQRLGHRSRAGSGGGRRRHPGAGDSRHDPGGAAQGRLGHRAAGGRRLPARPLSVAARNGARPLGRNEMKWNRLRFHFISFARSGVTCCSRHYEFS